MLQIVILTLFPALLVFAAVGDLLTYRIPNWVSLGLVGLFVLVAPFAGLSWAVLGGHLALAAGLLAIGMVLFSMGVFGGGDAKLLAAVGLWIGWLALPIYLVWATIIGGAIALMMLAFRKMPLVAAIETTPWIARLHDKKAGIPYGIALAAGAVIALPETIWFGLAAAPL